MMHYGSYHTDDPAADADRYYDDLESTYPEQGEEEYAVDMNFRICVYVKAHDRDEADNRAYDLIESLLRHKDLAVSEKLETTDIERA